MFTSCYNFTYATKIRGTSLASLTPTRSNTGTKTLKYLLSKNPKLDVKDKDGNTALHIAGKAGFEEAFKILKSAGASQIVKNNKGKVPKLMDPSKCCVM